MLKHAREEKLKVVDAWSRFSVKAKSFTMDDQRGNDQQYQRKGKIYMQFPFQAYICKFFTFLSLYLCIFEGSGMIVHVYRRTIKVWFGAKCGWKPLDLIHQSDQTTLSLPSLKVWCFCTTYSVQKFLLDQTMASCPMSLSSLRVLFSSHILVPSHCSGA